MFTVKYVYPTGQEMICGPYDTVSAEWVDIEGNHITNIDEHDAENSPENRRLPPDAVRPRNPRFMVVYCLNGGNQSMMLGPILPSQESRDVPTPLRRDGLVFVMNEQGATVAKYRL